MPVSYGGDAITFADGSKTTSAYTGFKNRLINSDMRIDQRNAGAEFTGTSGYPVDRWVIDSSQSSKIKWQRNAGSLTGTSLPVGFTNYVGATVTSTATIGAGDYFLISQRIEGFNAADLMWGTVNALTVNVSFWVRSSVTGTFSGCVRNGGNSRSYPFSYTINSANTWEQKSITVPGETTGTWATDNSQWGFLFFSLGTGSSNSGTANSWQSSSFVAVTGTTSLLSTNGATWFITGVQLEVGSSASTFDYRPYGTELALCYRYYFKNLPGASDYPFTNACIFSNISAYGVYPLPVTMRATPSVSFNSVNDLRLLYNSTGQNSSNAIGANATPNAVELWGTYSGLTAGQAAWMRAAGSASFVAFNSEL